jgi:hypothetical protein
LRSAARHGLPGANAQAEVQAVYTASPTAVTISLKPRKVFRGGIIRKRLRERPVARSRKHLAVARLYLLSLLPYTCTGDVFRQLGDSLGDRQLVVSGCFRPLNGTELKISNVAVGSSKVSEVGI